MCGTFRDRAEAPAGVRCTGERCRSRRQRRPVARANAAQRINLKLVSVRLAVRAGALRGVLAVVDHQEALRELVAERLGRHCGAVARTSPKPSEFWAAPKVRWSPVRAHRPKREAEPDSPIPGRVEGRCVLKGGGSAAAHEARSRATVVGHVDVRSAESEVRLVHRVSSLEVTKSSMGFLHRHRQHIVDDRRSDFGEDSAKPRDCWEC